MEEFRNLDETVALSTEEPDARGVVIEEEDETGAPKKVAWPLVDDEERLAPAEPADERLRVSRVPPTGTHLHD